MLDRWREAWRRRRDRILADPRVHRAVLANPFTRPFARRQARAIFDLCAGFVYSQTLLACVRLRLFETLRAEPLSVADIARLSSLSPEATARLLSAAASLSLVQARGEGLYGLGRLGAALLGNPAALAVIEHQSVFYADLVDPVSLLRGEARPHLAQYWPYSVTERPKDLDAAAVAPYSALMAVSQPLWAHEVLAVYSFAKHKRLLDVGGGEGAFLTEVAARAPQLGLMLFDLPTVADRARARLDGAGLSERAQVYAGDFLRDPLPLGADVVSLVRIVHDHDDASALGLLRNIRRALPAGGTLLIVEALAGVRGFEPLAAWYGFYTLAMGRGEPRSFEQMSRLLERAGFANATLIPTLLPAMTSLITAKAI